MWVVSSHARRAAFALATRRVVERHVQGLQMSLQVSYVWERLIAAVSLLTEATEPQVGCCVSCQQAVFYYAL